jgi:hypothetical protein
MQHNQRWRGLMDKIYITKTRKIYVYSIHLYSVKQNKMYQKFQVLITTHRICLNYIKLLLHYTDDFRQIFFLSCYLEKMNISRSSY